MELLKEMVAINEAISYDNDTKKLSGTTKEWLDAIGATKEDVAEAYAEATDLSSYEDLTKMVSDVTSASQKKNGTFKFTRLAGVQGSYEIYANGQIRVSMPNSHEWRGDYQTKLVSPKPRLKHGDVATSMKMIYDQAFKELHKKLEKIAKQAAKKVTEAKDEDDEDYGAKVGDNVENIQPMRAGKAYSSFGSPAKIGDKGKVTKVHNLRDVKIVQFKKSDGSIVYTHVQNLR